MLTRIITAAVALAIFIPVLYFASTAAFPIVMSVLCIIAVFELYNCVKAKKCRTMFVLALLCAAAFPLLARYAEKFIIPSGALFIVAVLATLVIDYNKVDSCIIGFTAFETIAVVLGLSLMVIVRDREPVRYLLIFVAAWGTDTFAYFSGRLFGKRKLCPEISPKKTVAGAIGGVLGCVFGFAVFGLVCNLAFDKDYSLLVLALIAIPLSVAGQFGDLAASTVKRRFNIKDYGKLFPGHGGVLDRFDSILPITLVAFIFTELVEIC